MLVLFSLLWRARVSSIVPPFASAHSNSKPALATPLVTGNVISKKEWGDEEKRQSWWFVWSFSAIKMRWRIDYDECLGR